MNKQPLVSVIVPVYNIKNYVEDCLNSICAQSYDNLEIIVVDDGSTDGSDKICDFLETKDKRIKVFHKKNEGLSEARNFGIEKAKGEILAFVDGDDQILKNFIERMYAGMIDKKVEIVICGYNDVAPKGRSMTGEEATAQLLIKQENIDIIACNKIYKKSLFSENNIKYPTGDKHEDSLTTYKLMAAAKRVLYIPESLYVYVKREGSIMNHVDNVERLKMRERAAEESVKYFNNNLFLKQAAEIAVLTSKYAFMDAAIHKEIEKKYYDPNSQWIKNNRSIYKKNALMTKKLKLYILLNQANLYKIFRTIV